MYLGDENVNKEQLLESRERQRQARKLYVVQHGQLVTKDNPNPRKKTKTRARVKRVEPPAAREPITNDEGYSRQRLYADFTLSGIQHFKDL